LLTYLKLKLYRRFQKRFKPHKTRIWDYLVFYNDPKSLFSEYDIIFNKKAYHFQSDNQSPLIIDGGGHIGTSALYFKYIYPGSKIIIFEPDPNSLELLRRNISINRIENVQIIEAGLYSKSGRINFDNNQTDGGKVSEDGSSSINVRKLSEYINSPIDFLKLNIEGAELEVIRELEQSGKIQNIRQICLEWHSFADQNQNLGELLSILERNNFKYLINHFDYRINPRLKPPFRLQNKTQYYLLIYAKIKENNSKKNV